MTFDEYRRCDATILASLVKKGDVTPTELLAIALKRTGEVNPKINAVVTLLEKEASEQIKNLAADSPFSGVPFLLKDLDVQLKGTPYTCGSRLMKDYVSATSSEIVNRMTKGGLVIFGKTNTPEFGLTPWTEGKLLGVARNPWNTAHTTGGSSGGSGAAVAAGIVPMAYASDGGGSIRIPASCGGLFGIKPSRGRITNGPHSGEVWSGAVCSGIISRSVRDAAAYIDLVSGPAPGDPYSIQQPDIPYAEVIKKSVRKLNIGFSYQMPAGTNAAIDSENVHAIETAVKILQDAGHAVAEVPLPYTQKLNTELLYTLVLGELSATLDFIGEQRGRKPQRDELEPNTWLLYKLGNSFSANAFAIARMKWNEINQGMAEYYRKYDLLLTPTLGRRPFKIGAMNNPPFEEISLRVLNALGISTIIRYTGMIEKIAAQTFGWIPYVALANITGQPSMTIPLHWTSEELPIGVMFTAPFGDEATLFQLAAQLEYAQPWFGRVPKIGE